MRVTSRAFADGERIPTQFSCEGQDMNPPLSFHEVPSEAKSLVLIMDDPDVPEFVRKDRMWDHWVVFNIPASVTEVKENSQPPGVAGKNTSGGLNYQGPCPPDREHRYFFKLYALDQELFLKEGATKKEVEVAMEGHILAKAELMGRYTHNRPLA